MVTHISSDASHVTSMKRSSSGRCRQAILASCMALALFSVPSLVWAGDSNKHRLINQQRVQDMKDKIADLREKMRNHKHHQHTGGGSSGSTQNLESRLAALEATVAGMTPFDPADLIDAMQLMQNQINNNNTTLTNLNVRVDGRNTAVGDLNTKVTDGVVPNLKNYVEVKTSDMNGVKGPHLVFRGVNVHVQSGSGATADTTSGLGNLISGYNEQATPEQVRLGAHNLVGGSQNGFGSYGGLVFGVNNKITATATYASVVSGLNNTASGASSAVVGGEGTAASGISSSVLGGRGRTASVQWSTSHLGGCSGC